MSSDLTSKRNKILLNINEINTRYARKQERLDHEKDIEVRLIQRVCEQIGHVPEFRQVVGDGAFCKICGVDLPGVED